MVITFTLNSPGCAGDGDFGDNLGDEPIVDPKYGESEGVPN